MPVSKAPEIQSARQHSSQTHGNFLIARGRFCRTHFTSAGQRSSHERPLYCANAEMLSWRLTISFRGLLMLSTIATDLKDVSISPDGKEANFVLVTKHSGEIAVSLPAFCLQKLRAARSCPLPRRPQPSAILLADKRLTAQRQRTSDCLRSQQVAGRGRRPTWPRCCRAQSPHAGPIRVRPQFLGGC